MVASVQSRMDDVNNVDDVQFLLLLYYLYTEQFKIMYQLKCLPAEIPFIPFIKLVDVRFHNVRIGLCATITFCYRLLCRWSPPLEHILKKRT